MGRTSKPLTLLVSEELAETEPFKKLAEQGHEIKTELGELLGGVTWELSDFDLILGPNAQLMTEAHLPYLDEALRRARKLKYGGKEDA
jgi:hypothetical protein